MHPTDPLYRRQSHLRAIGDIEKVWDDYDGTGVHVGVYDSGIDFTHPDLKDRKDRTRAVVIDGKVQDGSQNDEHSWVYQWHGTAVAGVIAASGNNGEGGVGVAFGASLTSVDTSEWLSPIFKGREDDAPFLEAIRQGAQFDVINNSWTSAGPWWMPEADLSDPTNRGSRIDAVDAVISQTGRGGLGTVIVQASGNEGENADSIGSNNSRYTITVAATNDIGEPASFSNRGASVLVSAPGMQLVTTDVPGKAGYAPGDYMEWFTGTSAAAPVVTGVVALMLQADPGLGWRDVQNILAASATRTGSEIGREFPNQWESGVWQVNGARTWNGGGLHTHTDFGYGAVNAFNAVRMAEAWRDIGAPAQTSANEIALRTGDIPVDAAIPDGSTVEYKFDVADDIVLDHVDLQAKITHANYKDLRLTLVSPDGTEVSLYDGTGSPKAASGLNWLYGVDGLRGEHSAGTWTLRVQDVAPGDVGTLDRISLAAYGSAPSPDTVYHYTDEFLSLAALDPSRLILDDRDGGRDWIEAAAMPGDLALDLHPGAMSYVGDAELFQLGDGRIENAIGGDGADRIIGNEGDNILFGGRGDDTLIGAGGSDTLHGDQGDDLLIGSEGNDILDGGAGNDTLIGGGGADTYLFGTNSGDDMILGFSAQKGDRIQLLDGQTFTLDTSWTGDALLRLSGGGTVDLLGVPAFLLAPDAVLA